MPAIDFNNRQAIKYGSTDIVAVYAGSSLVWNAPAFSSPNAAWTAAAFTGNGTKMNPFVSNAQAGVGDGMSIRVTRAGTIHITATSVSSDIEFDILLNGTAFSANGDYNGWSGPLNLVQTTPARARLEFRGENLSFTNLRIWWE